MGGASQKDGGAMTPLTLDFTDIERVSAIWEEAFQHPEQVYHIVPVDLSIAEEWIQNNAWMRSFGWGEEEKRAPLAYGKLIHLDELYYRNRCGYANAQEPEEDQWADMLDDPTYVCFHPQSEDKHCMIGGECPYASEACLEDLREQDTDLYEQYKCEVENDEKCGDWMILHSRPRWAYVPNITLVMTHESEASA